MTTIERIVERIKDQQTQAQLTQVACHKHENYVLEQYWQAYEDGRHTVLKMIEDDQQAEALTQGKEAPF